MLQSRYLLWLMLALPAAPFLEEFVWPGRYYPELMQESGVLSVQLLVFTLAITPVALLLKPYEMGRTISRWLLAKRRYFGLAAAGYAFIHTVLYLREISWDIELAWLESLDWAFGTGWIAMIAFLLVAPISNKWGIAKLGAWWKRIQRLSYAAAAAGLTHWLLLDFFIDDVLVWIIILVIAKLVHVLLRTDYFQLDRGARAKRHP